MVDDDDFPPPPAGGDHLEVLRALFDFDEDRFDVETCLVDFSAEYRDVLLSMIEKAVRGAQLH